MDARACLLWLSTQNPAMPGIIFWVRTMIAPTISAVVGYAITVRLAENPANSSSADDGLHRQPHLEPCHRVSAAAAPPTPARS
jgi:hypothetical protein